MQQAILGVENQKLVFYKKKLVFKLILLKSFPLFYIKLSSKIRLCFSIVTRYFRIRLKARPDPVDFWSCSVKNCS
jgi:hypothetical protein